MTGMEGVIQDKGQSDPRQAAKIDRKWPLRFRGALPHGFLQVFCGTLLATVLALRVTNSVDQPLFLWPVSAVSLGLSVPYWHSGWRKRVVLQLATVIGFLTGAAIVGMPGWLASMICLLTCIDLSLGRVILGPRIRNFSDLKVEKHILRFALLTIGLPILTGSLGAYPVSSFLKLPLLQTAAMNGFANSLGLALIFPVILFARSAKSFRLTAWMQTRGIMRALAGLLFVLVSIAIFWQDKGPFLFLVFPPMVLVLFVTGLEGAMFTSLALSIIAWVGTSRGHGPIWLMEGTPLEHLLALQTFVWVCLLTAIPIGALLDERRRAEHAAATVLLDKTRSLDENRRLSAVLQASNDLFTTFMNNGPFASYIKEADGSMVFYNRYLAQMGGVTEQAWIGLKDDEIWPAEMAAEFRRHDLSVLTSKRPTESYEVSPGPEGARLFWKTLKFPYYDAARERLLLAGISFDVTEDILREAALEDTSREKAALAQQIDASRQMLQKFLQSNPMLTYIKDDQGRFVFYNREVEEFFGISDTEWIGRTVDQVRSPAEAKTYKAQDRQILEDGTEIESIDTVEDKLGILRKLRSVKFSFQNFDGRTMLAKISQDITEQVLHEEALAEANRQLTVLAMVDSLTKLSTRRVFENRAEIEFSVAKRTGRPLSIIVLDIDNFKQRNDRHGHAAGDEALRVLGAVLIKSVRIGDTAARLGGEEFAFLLPDTNAEGALQVTYRIQSMLRAAPHGPVPLTVSLGVATLDKATVSWERLLAKADDAMYEAKRTGKNRAIHHQSLVTQWLKGAMKP